MSRAALIALLACAAATAAAAAAGCPRGWERVRSEVEQVAELGINRFKYVAHDEVCTEYPIYIESGGLREWAIDVQPRCTDGEGSFLFDVRAKNPCAGRRLQRGTMEIDTDPLTRTRDFIVPGTIYSGTTVTRRLDALPALQCPPGLEPASPLRLEDTIAPFVQDYVFANEEEVAPLFQAAGAEYCSVGFDSFDVLADGSSGCLQEAEPASLMAAVVVAYTCYGSNQEHTVAITLSGTYTREKTWTVSIEGLEPKRPRRERPGLAAVSAAAGPVVVPQTVAAAPAVNGTATGSAAAVQPAATPGATAAAQPGTNTTAVAPSFRPLPKPGQPAVQQPTDAGQPGDKPAEAPAAQPPATQAPAPQPAEQPVEQPAEQPAAPPSQQPTRPTRPLLPGGYGGYGSGLRPGGYGARRRR